MRQWVRWALLVALLLGSWIPGGRLRVHAAPPRLPPRASEPIHYVGWAVEAYPEQSAAEMEAMVQRIVHHGANVIWIGHNNPGIVDPGKVEPGLSYAIYEAYFDRSSQGYQAAADIIEAQHRILVACRKAGVKAVLPVGYQIQMGLAWNEAYPDALRRDAQGQVLDIYGGGVSASFYAPRYRHDIESYYRWLEAQFVQPYDDVLLMLNLADEPLGGDYSSHAEAEFRRRVGFGFADVGEDPTRQRLLGEFQSRYIVDYATYSANLWAEIHPDLPVTMSFDGAQARQTFTMPDVEALFRETPPNFVVTFDAYPRDGLPEVPLGDQNLVGLFLLARSIGLYSARYDKPVWLWAAANSWGLSQASPDPGTVSDAVANGIYLTLLVREGGGELQGIAYWNYNVKGQGLYNDSHDTTYDPDTMFARVSAGLPRLRRLMTVPPSHPEVLILSPPSRSYEQIGAGRAAVILEVQPYDRLAILAKEGVNTAVVSSLQGWSLANVRAIVVLTPSADDLHPDDLSRLRDVLRRGVRVVTSPGVGTVLAAAVQAVPILTYGGLVEQRDDLYLAQQGIAVLFEDRRHELLAGFWQEVLGLAAPQPGYRILAGDYAFHYHLGPEPVRVAWEMPFEVAGHHYDDNARSLDVIHGQDLAVTLDRREYLLLRRVWLFWPWA